MWISTLDRCYSTTVSRGGDYVLLKWTDENRGEKEDQEWTVKMEHNLTISPFSPVCLSVNARGGVRQRISLSDKKKKLPFFLQVLLSITASASGALCVWVCVELQLECLAITIIITNTSQKLCFMFSCFLSHPSLCVKSITPNTNATTFSLHQPTNICVGDANSNYTNVNNTMHKYSLLW